MKNKTTIKPFGATPTYRQLYHYKLGKKAFFHFGVNTFSGNEWGDGTEKEKSFNPTDLDVRGWIRDVKAAGFKLAIITAKHHDGFCLWPSKYTEHSVKNSPYKDGKGDICTFLSHFLSEMEKIGKDGTIGLITGNHDYNTLQDEKALECFSSVEKMLRITDGDRTVLLCHYPVAEWNGKRCGGYHVYGHLHVRRDEVFEFMSRFDRALNAGCMLNGYRPATLDELIENNLRFRQEA